MSEDFSALDRTIDTLTARLLERRTAGGHWEGRLASSALSTATATVALMLEQRASGHDRRSLIRSGLAWLIANQNIDGGWGDTVVSFSNLSTTVLCWSALSLCVEAHESTQTAIERAEGWLAMQVGDLSGSSLKRAILARTERIVPSPRLF
jgi:squalene-hopene/tetraprenyl-beta-curcumene cyclase